MNTPTFAEYSLTIKNPSAHGRLIYEKPKWYEKILYRIYFHSPLFVIAMCIWCLLELWA